MFIYSTIIYWAPVIYHILFPGAMDVDKTKSQSSWSQPISQTYPNSPRKKQMEDINKNWNANRK